MSDGNTATTLAPSEDDMRKVREVFDNMRDTVINSSQLAGEVAQLREAVAQLSSDLNKLRETNHWMDSQLTEVRGQRDQLARDKASTIDSLNGVSKERDSLLTTVENQRGELHRLNEEVSRLKRERDDAEMRALEQEEHAKELSNKLQAIGSMFAPQAQKEPEQPRLPTGQFASPKEQGQAQEEKPYDHVSEQAKGYY